MPWRTSTTFNSVIATGTRFKDAHIYGIGAAFEGARQLNGASCVGAVLAGSVDGQLAFDFTGADLTAANFRTRSAWNATSPSRR